MIHFFEAFIFIKHTIAKEAADKQPLLHRGDGNVTLHPIRLWKNRNNTQLCETAGQKIAFFYTKIIVAKSII